MQNSVQDHWVAAMRVLNYLKSSLGQGLYLSKGYDLQLKGYYDSNRATCPITPSSVIAYFVTLGSAPIYWKTKKQTTALRLSTEAEYRAMAVATGRHIHQGLGIMEISPSDVQIRCSQCSHPNLRGGVIV